MLDLKFNKKEYESRLLKSDTQRSKHQCQTMPTFIDRRGLK